MREQEKEGETDYIPNSLTAANMTLASHRQRKISRNEDHRPISLINIDIKVQNSIKEVHTANKKDDTAGYSRNTSIVT